MSRTKTTHVVGQAPQQVEGPKATLPQLAELTSLYAKGKQPDRAYMQGFLRKQLVYPHTVIKGGEPAPANPIMDRIEELAQKHYPDAVNEILELVAPFCDPNLDFEFQQLTREFSTGGEVREAIEFMFPHTYIRTEFLTLGLNYRKAPIHGDYFVDLVRNNIYPDAFQTLEHLFPTLQDGARPILKESGLSNYLWKTFHKTGASRYRMLSREPEDILFGIEHALEKAIVLIARGDFVRLKKVVNFLTFQRSGRPVIDCKIDGDSIAEASSITAYVLCASHDFLDM